MSSNPRNKRIVVPKDLRALDSDNKPNRPNKVPIRQRPEALQFGVSESVDKDLEKRILQELPKRDNVKKDDVSMITAMAQRLRHSEDAMKRLRGELKEKDMLILDLRKEVESLRNEDSSRPKSAPDSPAGNARRRGTADINLLKESNVKLRLQIQEMEKFLSD